MFTDTDIKNIAVQIEQNGEETYRAAAGDAADKELSKMLCWMADEERRHRLWFEALEIRERPKTPEQIEMEAMGRGLLQEMIKSRTFSLEQEQLSDAEQLGEVIGQCRDFEADTILFYEFIKGLLDDGEAEKQLDLIIGEERTHLQQLEQLLATLGGTGELPEEIEEAVRK